MQWFLNAAEADAEDETDAAERAADLANASNEANSNDAKPDETEPNEAKSAEAESTEAKGSAEPNESDD